MLFPIVIAVRDMLNAVLSDLLHFVVSLLYGIPTVFNAPPLHGIASPFLDM